MKRIVMFLAIIIICSCNKNEDATFDVKLDSDWKFSVDLLENEEDLEDEKIKLALYETVKMLRDRVLTKSKNINVLSAQITKNEFPYKVEDVVSFFDESISSVQINDMKAELAELSEGMNYRSVLYYPAISLMNKELENVNLNKPKQIILALSESVTDEDEIPGWLIENGKYQEILISEEDLLGNTPIYIVQNHTDHIEEIPNSPGEWSGKPAHNGGRTTGPISIQFTQRQIKNGYRYESGNRKSKVHYEFTLYRGTFPYYNNEWKDYLWYYDVNNSKYDKRIQEISKSSVNSSQSFTGIPQQDIVWNHPAIIYDEGDAKYYCTVYEHDWYASSKAVQSCMTGIGSLTHYAKMNFSDNWYYQDYCDFSAKDSWTGASFSVSNDKCSFTLTRTL